MTGDSRSPLARGADATIDIAIDSEADPLGLAPTSSTTVTLAMGDALVAALMEARSFTPADFGVNHPGRGARRRRPRHPLKFCAAAEPARRRMKLATSSDVGAADPAP